MKDFMLVGLGGFFGSIARYGIYLWVDKQWATNFPLATWLVNMTGCLLIGIFLGYLSRSEGLDSARLVLVVGFCGSFTTYSTFANDKLQLLQASDFSSFIGYLILTLLLGILCVYVGYVVSRAF